MGRSRAAERRRGEERRGRVKASILTNEHFFRGRDSVMRRDALSMHESLLWKWRPLEGAFLPSDNNPHSLGLTDGCAIIARRKETELSRVLVHFSHEARYRLIDRGFITFSNHYRMLESWRLHAQQASPLFAQYCGNFNADPFAHVR